MVTTRSMRTGGQPTGSSAATKNGDGSINADPQPMETSNEPSKDTQTDQNTPIRTYRGNCHCKAFVYQVQLPELTSAVECNCSICYKKGYLWTFVDTKKIEVVKGSDASLSRYSFGSQRLEHKVWSIDALESRIPLIRRQFCPTCATPLMAEQVRDGTTALNVSQFYAALQSWVFADSSSDTSYVPCRISMYGLWTNNRKRRWSRPVRDTNADHGCSHDGDATGEVHPAPVHQGPLPATSTDHQLYIGACHCGALTVAFMSKPLDETSDVAPAECNCSICRMASPHWPLLVVKLIRSDRTAISGPIPKTSRWYCMPVIQPRSDDTASHAMCSTRPSARYAESA